MPKIKKRFNWSTYLIDREQNGAQRSKATDVVRSLYSNLRTRLEFIGFSSISSPQPSHSEHDSVFNLEYSPDGSYLVATTAQGHLQIYAPERHKLIRRIPHGHSRSINYAKFLDNKTFASCSDDTTVALWDLRRSESPVCTLRGHTYLVKNIEYDPHSKRLITSAFDGLINAWNVTDNREYEQRPQTLLKCLNLLRMRLTPDLSKMIISTSDGFLMVIHDLDLDRLSSDLKGFNCELYHMMQKGSESLGLDMGSWYNHLFTRSRNRVELISDFPPGDDDCSIASLDVHPHGWCTLSRNLNKNEENEWTTVHDIQDDRRPHELVPLHFSPGSPLDELLRKPETGASGPDEMDSPVVIIANPARPVNSHTFLRRGTDFRMINHSDPAKIYKNLDRLLYFKKEANVGHGIIKELCFSPDGRLICSPYKNGYRILGFDSACNELTDCMAQDVPSPRELATIKESELHADNVVTVKFSPFQSQIASGCLQGRVCFSQPIL